MCNYKESHLYMWQPDPLMETLESVVGDHETLDGRLKAAQADTEVIVFTC